LDEELNEYIQAWQDYLQDKYEFAWGTATVTTSLATNTLTAIATDIHRLDAIYWNNARIVGKTKQDLDVLLREWRESSAATPYVAYQNSETVLNLWPPPSIAGTLVLEYPRQLTFSDDNTSIGVPPWTKYSAINYCLYRAYLRFGANQNIDIAMRRKANFLRQCQRFKTIYDNYLPYRYPSIRMAGAYEKQLLEPTGPLEVTLPSMPISQFTQETPSGTIDGDNRTFTLTVTPTELMLFKNGVRMYPTTDYTLAGYTITFTIPSVPQTGDTLLATIYRS
jgi:hypothetical protein